MARRWRRNPRWRARRPGLRPPLQAQGVWQGRRSHEDCSRREAAGFGTGCHQRI